MRATRRTLVACALPLAVAWSGARSTPVDAPAPVFVHDVLPLLQRQGCASAYCHGAATGQGGFKLSLFGSDPRADHAAITRALGGRRLDLQDPDASLVLQKPMRKLAHGGGKRIVEHSGEHRLLHAWIAARAPYEATPPRALTALDLRLPVSRLVVEATFATSDGDDRVDVSALATFSTSDERVVAVDKDGDVTFTGPGEAFLFARYAGTSARLPVLRPFAAPRAAAPGASEHPLDVAFTARLVALGLTPAPAAAPQRIARRLYLDLVDRPPTPTELQRFLALPAGTRVAQTADALLATPAFADVAARRLLRELEVPDDDGVPTPARAGLGALRQRVRAIVAGDEPLPALTRDLLAPGSAFLGRREDPRDRAELVGRALLGVRIGCARCHDHPHDRWRQQDHLAFAACFAEARAGEDGMAASSLYDPASGAAIAPRLLPLPTKDAPEGRDLHAFVHDQAHDLFARALTNRVFAWLLGSGLVEPLDDHRDTNPARHEAWLAALQATFHAGGERLRPLVRAIVTSQLYQLDAGDQDGAASDDAARWFARRVPKPLDATVLRAALAAALGVERHALAPLPDSPLARRLALVNGDSLTRALQAPGNTVEILEQLGGEARAQLDELFVTCLTRLPSDAERAAFLPGAPTNLRDLAGALLLSREFEFLR